MTRVLGSRTGRSGAVKRRHFTRPPVRYKSSSQRHLLGTRLDRVLIPVLWCRGRFLAGALISQPCPSARARTNGVWRVGFIRIVYENQRVKEGFAESVYSKPLAARIDLRVVE